MNRPLIQIDTVEIPISNLQRAVDWYEAALGLRKDWSDDHHALLSIPEPDGETKNPSGVRILLVQTEDPVRLGFTNTSNHLQHAVIDFKTPQLEALHALLQTLGTHVDDLQPPVNAWAPRGFGFFDSEGNRLAAFTYSNATPST